MMADPDGDTVLVEHGTDVMRMHPVDIEGQDAEPALPAGDEAHAGDAGQAIDPVTGQRLLVLADRLAAQAFDEIEGNAEPDGASDIGGAGLEAVRRVLELGLFVGDVDNHAAAGLPGRHRGERFVAPVQDAYPARAVSLVPGEDVEIAAESPHIDRHPRDR